MDKTTGNQKQPTPHKSKSNNKPTVLPTLGFLFLLCFIPGLCVNQKPRILQQDPGWGQMVNDMLSNNNPPPSPGGSFGPSTSSFGVSPTSTPSGPSSFGTSAPSGGFGYAPPSNSGGSSAFGALGGSAFGAQGGSALGNNPGSSFGGGSVFGAPSSGGSGSAFGVSPGGSPGNSSFGYTPSPSANNSGSAFGSPSASSFGSPSTSAFGSPNNASGNSSIFSGSSFSSGNDSSFSSAFTPLPGSTSSFLGGSTFSSETKKDPVRKIPEGQEKYYPRQNTTSTGKGLFSSTFGSSEPSYGMLSNGQSTPGSGTGGPRDPLQRPVEPIPAPESSKPPGPSEGLNVSFPKEDQEIVQAQFEIPEGIL